MSYILLVDDEKDILEILEVSLNMQTHMKVRTSTSGNKAWDLMLSEGKPTLIISDYRMPDGDGVSLYKRVVESMPEVPFVVCSANPVDELQTNFPKAYDYLCKPQFFEPLNKLLEKFLTYGPQRKPAFVQVPLGFLLRLGVVNVDGYIKISEDKYIKVHQGGDIFDREDVEKLQRKLINHLYITLEDALSLAKNFEDFLTKKTQAAGHGAAGFETAYEIVETTQQFSRALGWSDDTVVLAKQAVDLTIKIVSRDVAWAKILRDLKFSGSFGSHISLQALLVCLVAEGIGWSSEATKQKLVMASLLHDFFLEEVVYDILARGGPEAQIIIDGQPYRQHPIRAAELSRTLKNLPSDVDHILLQHHERPDGSGFPRGLTGPHISPMSAIFIICEELQSFCHGKEITPELIENFWKKNPNLSQKEPFKKIAASMRQKAFA